MSGASVDTIMFNVVLALLPATAFAVYAFGLTALSTLCTAVIACVVTEHVLCRFNGRETTVGDWSAVLTGLLYGLTLPPGLPLWMVAVGGVVASASASSCSAASASTRSTRPWSVARSCRPRSRSR